MLKIYLKKFFILINIILFFYTSSLFAQEEKLLVVTEQWPPYNFKNKNGKIDGLSTKIITSILNRANVDYEIKVLPWKRAFIMAQTEKNVLIYTIYRSAEREKLFQHWIGPIGRASAVYFYKLESRTDVVLNNIEDAKKYTIGVLRGDYVEDLLTTMGFKQINRTSYFKQNVLKFLNKRFDLLPAGEINLKLMFDELKVDPSGVVKILPLFEDKVSKIYSAFSYGTNQNIINKVIKANTAIQNENLVDKVYGDYLNNH